MTGCPAPSRRWAGNSASPGSGSARSSRRPSPSSATRHGHRSSGTSSNNFRGPGLPGQPPPARHAATGVGLEVPAQPLPDHCRQAAWLLRQCRRAGVLTAGGRVPVGAGGPSAPLALVPASEAAGRLLLLVVVLRVAVGAAVLHPGQFAERRALGALEAVPECLARLVGSLLSEAGGRGLVPQL